ncbi:hypothetical protein CVT26_012892, partial [Gymnopilus dilepis]
AIWFEHKRSHGVVFEKWFKPVRAETIALIFTLIDFALDGWSTGLHVKAALYEKEVKSRYQVFRTHVNQWKGLNESIVNNMLTKLFERACRDAGVAEDNSVQAALDEDHLKRMREELEGHTGETDSEADDEGSGTDEEMVAEVVDTVDDQ